jgi:hypothetical protein
MDIGRGLDKANSVRQSYPSGATPWIETACGLQADVAPVNMPRKTTTDETITPAMVTPTGDDDGPAQITLAELCAQWSAKYGPCSRSITVERCDGKNVCYDGQLIPMHADPSTRRRCRALGSGCLCPYVGQPSRLIWAIGGTG